VDERAAAGRADELGIRLIKVSYQDLLPDGSRTELRDAYWLIESETSRPGDFLTIDDVVKYLDDAQKSHAAADTGPDANPADDPGVD
jgi:hypothetical protein